MSKLKHWFQKLLFALGYANMCDHGFHDFQYFHSTELLIERSKKQTGTNRRKMGVEKLYVCSRCDATKTEREFKSNNAKNEWNDLIKRRGGAK